MEEYFILLRESGISTMVKVGSFFRQQGGDTEDWGKNWISVQADSIEHAREIGERMKHENHPLRLHSV